MHVISLCLLQYFVSLVLALILARYHMILRLHLLLLVDVVSRLPFHSVLLA